MRKVLESLNKGINAGCVKTFLGLRNGLAWIKTKLADNKGQGTTEYAILVGVLVVIAIAAIALLKPELEGLWDNIVEQIKGL